jgi:hypothetical protein
MCGVCERAPSLSYKGPGKVGVGGNIPEHTPTPPALELMLSTRASRAKAVARGHARA